MANDVQLENGFARVANEIFEVLARTNLNGTQRRILDVVFRQTYGYQRKSHDLSISFIAKATELNKMQIQRELATLIDRNIIKVFRAASFNKSRKIGLNKNYSEWLQLAKKLTVSENDNHTVSGLVNTTVSELANQIKKKENIKEIYDYYLTLGLVKHIRYTNDMAKSIKKAMKDNKYDIEYCKTLLKRHKKVVEITKNNEKPVEVRGLAPFFGQKAYNATHLICSEYEEGGKLYEKYLNKDKPKNKPNDPYAGLDIY